MSVTIAKLGHNDDLKASKVAIDQVGHYFVTASRDENNRLAITSWRLGPRGRPLVYDQQLGGDVGYVDVRHVGSNMFATPVQDSGNNLKVITWSLDPWGKITRLEQIKFGRINGVSTDVFKYHHRLVVGMIDSNGELRIKLIAVAPRSGAMKELHTEVAHKIQQVDIEASYNGLINAYTKNDAGKLEVRSFHHRRTNIVPASTPAYTSGNLGGIKVAKQGGMRQGGVGSRVCLIISNGNLKITSIQYKKSRSPRDLSVELVREPSVQFDTGDALSICSNVQDNGFWTAVEDTNGNLRVDLWGWGEDDGLLPRPTEHPKSFAHATGHNAKEIDCVAPYAGYTLLTASCSSNGELHVASWRAQGVADK